MGQILNLSDWAFGICHVTNLIFIFLVIAARNDDKVYRLMGRRFG